MDFRQSRTNHRQYNPNRPARHGPSAANTDPRFPYASTVNATHGAHIPDNLHEPIQEAFNVDPNNPYIDAGADEVERAQRNSERSPGGRGRLAGAMLGGLRDAVTRDRDATPAVDPPVERRRPQVRDISQRIPEPEPEPEPEPSSRTAPPMQAQNYNVFAFPNLPPATIQWVTSTGVPIGPPQPVHTHQYYPNPLLQQDATDGLDGTAIPRTVDVYGDADTTAVSHDGSHVHTVPQDHVIVPPPGAIGSPVLVEPRPGSDYAKMSTPSPPVSFMSLNTHLRRIRDFFKAVNDLPWVSEERVTVDYIPKGARKQISGITRTDLLAKRGHDHRISRGSSDFNSSFFRRRISFAIPRPLTSWYGRNSVRQSVDLLSGSSSTPSQTIEPFPALGYAPSATPAQQDVSLPVHSMTPHPFTPPDRTRSVPPADPVEADQMYTDEDPNTDMEEARLASNTLPGAWPPAYPHGYAAYQSPIADHTQDEAIRYIPVTQTQNAPVAFVVGTGR